METTSKIKSLERYSSSIVTVLFIALLVFGYLTYILPQNKAKEDKKNIAILKGIENKLLSYIDDQVKHISDEKLQSEDFAKYKNGDGVYIDKITIDKYGFQSLQNGTIELTRLIKFSQASKRNQDKNDKNDKNDKKNNSTVKDVVRIDLVKFLNKINSTTFFTSFYMCPVEDGRCRVDKTFNAQNISLSDQDSLVENCRKSGPISFKKSSKHYYTNQINIPQTNHNLFLVAGIDKSYFESNARQVNSKLLILSLVAVIILILGVNFIKPIISSPNERLSQVDLVGVVFSVGILSAVLVVFGVLSLWNTTTKERNKKDLTELVDHIDYSFSNQIENYLKIRRDEVFKKEFEKPEYKSSQIFIEKDYKPTEIFIEKEKDTIIRNENFFYNCSKREIINIEKTRYKSKKLKYLDLFILIDNLDDSFFKQIVNYRSFGKNLIFNDSIKKRDYSHFKISDQNDSVFTSLNGDSILKKLDSTEISIKETDFIKKIKELQSLDVFFQMDNRGLITKYLSAITPEVRRKFADREYFKVLQPKNKDHSNINSSIKTYLTAVFSREQDRYQWIYAERDSKNVNNHNVDSIGIKGFAFREYFSREIGLPPGTSYMLVDRSGNVLMHENSKSSLLQNVFNGDQNNLELVSALSGAIPKTFDMVFQGKAYQVCAKKLNVKTDSPVYIFGIRDLTHINRLAIYTFSNGLLISIFFGFFLLVINYVYSIVFYSGKVSIFSNRHFSYLFPDKSRTADYRILMVINCVSIVTALIVFLFFSPSIVFVFCVLLSINLAFTNLMVLNTRILNSKKEVQYTIGVLLILQIISFVIFLFFVNFWFAIFMLCCFHIILVFCYKERDKNKNKKVHVIELTESVEAIKNEEAVKNEGVNRISFISFLTVRLFFQYIVFPFILVSSFYVGELNDFVRFYSSSKKESPREYYVKAYNSCIDALKIPVFKVKKDSVLQEANFDFLNRPALYEIKKFTFFDTIKNDYFLNSFAIFQKENRYFLILIFVCLFIFLPIVTYQFINYYSNRFFFYDLMQVSYEGVYFSEKRIIANRKIFIYKTKIDTIRSLVENCCNQSEEDYAVKGIFKDSDQKEIPPLLKENFKINHYKRKFSDEYNRIWESLPDKHARHVLYDFAQDYFVNYKNKDIIMDLMKCGIIDSDKVTGRLKMMNVSFRMFVLCKSKSENFIEEFKSESKNGTYSRFKFPLFIIAISALLLLMYLNKDSYEQVAAMGGSIVTVVALISKFIDVNKSI